VPGIAHPEVEFGTEMILLAFTIIMVAVIFFVVRNIYVTKKKMALPEEEYKGLERFLLKNYL
jgi:NADH-quinone oxidoreductase subunit L